MEVEKIQVFRTSDGKIFEKENEATIHARELRWFRFCDENNVSLSDAETLWHLRQTVVFLLDEGSPA